MKEIPKEDYEKMLADLNGVLSGWIMTPQPVTYVWLKKSHITGWDNGKQVTTITYWVAKDFAAETQKYLDGRKANQQIIGKIKAAQEMLSR